MLVTKFVMMKSVLIICLLLISTVSLSTEIKSFGYLGYEGQFNLDFLNEDSFLGVEQEASTDEERTIKQGKVDLLFHTFIYHPNFVKFDIGLGLVLSQTGIKNRSVIEQPIASGNYEEQPLLIATRDSQEVDFSLLFSFFEKKNFPFSLYYSVKHPNLSATSVDAFISENTRYGLKFLWNAPVTINFDAVHFETKGDSNLRIIDEVVDSTTIKAFKSLSNNGYQQFSINHQVSESKSGSKLDKIYETKNTSDNVNYDGQFNFGEKEKFNFNLRANYQRNRDSFEFDETGIIPGLRWKHSERLKSYYQYSYNQNVFTDYKIVNHIAVAGLTYANLRGISNSTNFSANRSELANATTKQSDVRNSTSYNTVFKGGSFSLNATISVGQHDSKTSLTEVLYRESIVLINNTPITLTKTTILTNKAITVISAKNESIIYQEDIDYRLTRRNGVVTIEIIKGSLILFENDKVFVDYFYDPGGNSRFQQQTKSVTTQINFFEYLNVFAGYSDFSLSNIDGAIASTQVTTRITNNYGAGFDVPFFSDNVLLGSEIRYDNSDENITETNSVSRHLYSQFRLLRSTNLYLSRRHTIINYLGVVGESNNVDKVTYHAMLKIQPSNRTNISLIYDDSKDVGGIRVRSYTESALRYEWHYRRVIVNLTASLFKENQGTLIRKRKTMHLNFIRTF